MLQPSDPRDAEIFRVLDLLCASGLADIPQVLITPDQLERVLRGESVSATASQRRLAMRVGAVEAHARREARRGGMPDRWSGPPRPALVAGVSELERAG